MKRIVRLGLLLVVTLFVALKVIYTHLLYFSVGQTPPKKMLAVVMHRWCKSVASILSIKIETTYETQFYEENFLIVANHQSYFDIVVIGSVFPALFLAKKEVKSWPLISRLASLIGTLFIDRKAFRGAIVAGQEISEALCQGTSVQIFPEGTSTDGSRILSFKPSLIKAAIDISAAVLPITINYRYINEEIFSAGNRDIVCWYGAMEFGNHFWNLLKQNSVGISLFVHAPFQPPHQTAVHEFTQTINKKVSSKFYGLEERQANNQLPLSTREVSSS